MCMMLCYQFSKRRRKVGKVCLVGGRGHHTAVFCRASDSWTIGEPRGSLISSPLHPKLFLCHIHLVVLYHRPCAACQHTPCLARSCSIVTSVLRTQVVGSCEAMSTCGKKSPKQLRNRGKGCNGWSTVQVLLTIGFPHR